MRRKAPRVSLVAPIPQPCSPFGPFAKPSEETWQRTRVQSRSGLSTQFGDLVTTWSSGSVGYPLGQPQCSAQGPPTMYQVVGRGIQTCTLKVWRWWGWLWLWQCESSAKIQAKGVRWARTAFAITCPELSVVGEEKNRGIES